MLDSDVRARMCAEMIHICRRSGLIGVLRRRGSTRPTATREACGRNEIRRHFAVARSGLAGLVCPVNRAAFLRALPPRGPTSSPLSSSPIDPATLPWQAWPGPTTSATDLTMGLQSRNGECPSARQGAQRGCLRPSPVTEGTCATEGCQRRTSPPAGSSRATSRSLTAHYPSRSRDARSPSRRARSGRQILGPR